MKGIVKKLCDIDGIAIAAEMLEVHVDDKQVEQAIERLSLRYAKECPAETAQNGDLVRCHAEAVTADRSCSTPAWRQPSSAATARANPRCSSC